MAGFRGVAAQGLQSAEDLCGELVPTSHPTSMGKGDTGSRPGTQRQDNHDPQSYLQKFDPKMGDSPCKKCVQDLLAKETTFEQAQSHSMLASKSPKSQC